MFIYHDLAAVNFYPKVNKQYNLSANWDYAGIFLQPGGKRVNKYAIGTACFEFPFFIAAHLYCRLTHSYLADGYSIPYRLAAILCTVFWVTLGLFALRKFLLCYFNDNVTSFTLICIAFGTNLYAFTVFSPAMSHPYLFFLVSCLLFQTEQWHKNYSGKHIYYIGLILGFIIITRPIDVIAAIVPLLWELNTWQSITCRIKLFVEKKKDLLIAISIFFLVSLVQLSYWKYTSGHWIYYSYQGEGFNFAHPAILKGLFSYQKGWFLYTPIAVVSIIGLQSLYRFNKTLCPAIVLYMCVMIYLVFSWEQWWYGSGFSCRALIEALPVLSLPLASFVNEIFFAYRQQIMSKVSFLILLFFIILNIFQSYQYINYIIDGQKMTRKSYWRVWGKLDVNLRDEAKYLLSEEELKHEYNRRSK